MKKRWGAAVFFGAGLVLGGWLGSRFTEGERGPAVGEKPVTGWRAERLRERGAGREAEPGKWAVMVKTLGGMSNEERMRFPEELAAKDRLGVIEALAAGAGPGGLDRESRWLLDRILADWVAEDFDGAWAAVEGLGHEGLRRYLVDELLGELAKDEPERALGLYLDELAKDPKLDSGVPLAVMAKRTGEGADRFMELLVKLPFGSSSRGTTMNFAEDFDFGKVADEVAKLRGPEQKSAPVFPSNFFEKWTERDPAAAFEWWSKNGNLDFNDFGSLLTGVEKSQGAEAAAAWALAKMEESRERRERVIKDLTKASDSDLEIRVKSIAGAMPDAAARDRFLEEVVTINRVDDPMEHYGFAISGMSSPAARLALFGKLRDQSARPGLGHLSDAQFQAWGVTRAEVEGIFTRGK